MAPGGLGPEVTPLIRAVTLPGFNPLMGVLTLPRLTGLPYGVIVAAVTAVALLAFAAIGRFARSK